MSAFQKTAFLLFLLAFVSGSCGSNRPLKAPSLRDEADRYTAAFSSEMKMGRYKAALSDAERALAVNTILDRDDPLAVSHNNLGTVQERMGMPEEAEASYAKAVTLAKKTGNGSVLGVALNNLAGLTLHTDVSLAEDRASQARRLGEEGPWPGIQARAVHILARAALEKGAIEQSRQFCEEGLLILGKSGDRGARAAILVTLGRVEAAAGNYVAAIKFAEEALAIDRVLEDPYAIAQDHARLAEIYKMSGDTKRAAASRERAGEILKILGVGEVD
jgi:tetratricopeptide (TPR) repeat protein